MTNIDHWRRFIHHGAVVKYRSKSFLSHLAFGRSWSTILWHSARHQPKLQDRDGHGPSASLARCACLRPTTQFFSLQNNSRY